MSIGSTKTARGFTLIELMITLVVAAILLAWGVPSFQRFIENTTLTSATNQWVGVLNSARSEAVTRGERVTVCRTISPNACDGSADCTCGVDQGGAESGRPNYHHGYLIFTSTGNAQSINFQVNGPDGTPGNDDDNQLLRTGRTQSERITIRGNGQGNNAFSFMPDGTLDPNDVSAGGVTARHVICITDNPADRQDTKNSETTDARAVIISVTGRPRVAEVNNSDCSADEADGLAG